MDVAYKPYRYGRGPLAALLLLGLGCTGSSSDAIGIQPGQLAVIALTPATVTMAPSGAQLFVASCRDIQGIPVACPDLNWTVNGGTRQSTSTAADTAGLFTAGSSTGIFSLSVSGGNRQQSATVTIVTGNNPPNVVVNPAQTFQTWEAWEVASTNSADPPYSYSTALADSVTHLAVNELGINRIRLQAAWNNIETDGTSSGNPDSPFLWKNDNADPNSTNAAGFRWTEFDKIVTKWVLPLKQRAGSDFLLNLNIVCMQSSCAPVRANPAEYAEFGVTVLEHLRSTFNLTPQYFELMLEPQVTGTELGQDWAALRTRMQAAGFSGIMFIAPSLVNSNPTVSYANAVMAVAGNPSLDEISYHRYGAPTGNTLPNIAQLGSSLGANTSMLEHIGADQNELYDDLTQANNSAWQRYILAGPVPSNPTAKQGKYIYVTPSTGAITLEPGTWYLRQYMKYIRRGAVRVAAISSSGTIKPVAFKRPDGKLVVVANTGAAATLDVGGLPAGDYQVSFSTAAQPGAVGAVQTILAGQTFTTTIPASGVITISGTP
ncbi:MAG TPA: glycoside hydrolase family 30 beta sandwich domain-containing protein [Gemmatimonadales bacterium]|nr:glycoside hydrolase family 30 beta sandwich domain-containing protein [Gemmatimonadales bacterium]